MTTRDEFCEKIGRMTYDFFDTEGVNVDTLGAAFLGLMAALSGVIVVTADGDYDQFLGAVDNVCKDIRSMSSNRFVKIHGEKDA
jgi:hypothetical protein